MKKTLYILLFICLHVLYANGKTNSENDHGKDILSDSLNSITINFEYGEDAPSKLKNIYVIWIEDTTSGYLQNIFISEKLIKGGLSGTALPYWKINKYPDSSGSEIDAVTSATIANTDFSVSATIENSTLKNFVVYLEIDRSAEPNDWFSDQPALLYSVNINLDDENSEYELSPTGWTPNEATRNIIPNTPFGKLQKEMRYITNHKEGSSFGDADERSATRMVKKLTATLKKSTATNIVSERTDDFTISLFPNPTSEQINIVSKEIIEEVKIINMQGQAIFQIQPNTFDISFLLNKIIAPKGTYFANIKTSKGISTYKFLISE